MDKMNKIKYLVMDVDGTLTDGKIYIASSGELCKAFNIKDGYGIHDIVIAKGIIPVILTGRKSDIVLRRCKELGITEIHQGILDKKSKLNAIAENFSEVAYIGDDINDIACMCAIKEQGGVIGCPHDAVDQVKAVSDFIAKHDGGNGAVREFIDWITEETKW